MSYLEINKLNKSFGTVNNRVHVLNDIGLNIERGEFCVMLGPSGCGKSTLLNIIGAIDEGDFGSVSIDGELIETMNEKQLTRYRRLHLGYIFQSYNLIPHLSVRENIETGAYLSPHPLDLDELIDLLGLKAHQDQMPNELSGGQAQRCAIGRALVKNPDLLLCDEPTGALDYKTSKDILTLLEDINNKYHCTVIMVTHNEALAKMGDHVIRLRDGQVREDYYNQTKIPVRDLEW